MRRGQSSTSLKAFVALIPSSRSVGAIGDLLDVGTLLFMVGGVRQFTDLRREGMRREREREGGGGGGGGGGEGGREGERKRGICVCV